MPHTLIIGAGISGLTAAWELKKKNQPFTLIEKDTRAGGWIETDTSQGYIFETGPRSLRPHPTTLALIEELHLEDEIILSSPSAKKRYIYSKGKLKQVPHAFPFMIVKALIKDFLTKPSSLDDESVYDFFRRRFGKNLADTLGDAFVTGIFAGDSKQLSLKCCFPKLFEMERSHGSIVKALFSSTKKPYATPFISRMMQEPLFTFKEGLSALTNALAKQVNPQLAQEAISITTQNDTIKVTLKSGNTLIADRLIIATHADKLLNLPKVPTASLISVSFGWKKSVLTKEGFGYLVPHIEKQNILGVVFDSSAFPLQNKHPEETRLTVMMGGARNSNVPQDKAGKLALQTISAHLGIHEKPDAMLVKSAYQAIPQYPPHFSKTLKDQLQHIPPCITLLGSPYDGVSINECIQAAHEKA